MDSAGSGQGPVTAFNEHVSEAFKFPGTSGIS
jgi:hypothetical protein